RTARTDRAPLERVAVWATGARGMPQLPAPRALLDEQLTPVGAVEPELVVPVDRGPWSERPWLRGGLGSIGPAPVGLVHRGLDLGGRRLGRGGRLGLGGRLVPVLGAVLEDRPPLRSDDLIVLRHPEGDPGGDEVAASQVRLLQIGDRFDDLL